MTWIRSIRIGTWTPCFAARAVMVSIWWLLPSTTANQGRSLVAGVAAVRLGERVRDHLPGRAADGGEQRLAVRVRPGLRGGTAGAAAAGGAEQGGDDVAGGARSGRDVGDGGQLGHPLAGLTQL